MDLNNIKDPSFLKELDIRQLNQLSSNIREFLITNISKTGGHLSGVNSNEFSPKFICFCTFFLTKKSQMIHF